MISARQCDVFDYLLLLLRTPLKLYFSAPVDERTSKVQILKDKKKLRCHFPKNELGVFGQACIKRPPIMDVSTLPRWTSKEDLKYGAFTCYDTFLFLQTDIREVFTVVKLLIQNNRKRVHKNSRRFF